MSLDGALTRLESWSVGSATTVAYDADERIFMGDELPILIVRFPDTYNEAFDLVNVNADEGIANILIEHCLLLSGLGLGVAHFGDFVSYIDSYLGAVIADSMLNGELIKPLRILQIKPGIIEYSGVGYYGVLFLVILSIEYT